MRATGAIARIVMSEWDKTLMKILEEECGLLVENAARYVDDVRLLLKPINLGWRWVAKGMEFREDWKKEEEGKTNNEKTAEVLKCIMNSIFPSTQFTTETAEDFASATLPTLDTQLWVHNDKVMYSYYEKPTSSKQVIARKSAMSENGKVASLSQDLVRRLKNTNLELPQEEKNEIVNQYSRKLTTSGYSRDQVHRVVTAGLRGFEKMAKRQQEGLGNIHRPAAEGAAARNRAKLLGKTNWFKPRKCKEQAEHPAKAREAPLRRTNVTKRQAKPIQIDRSSKQMRTTSVLFVEQTPGGELARRYRQAEINLSAITGFRIKVVEKTGTAVKNILHKSNPWAEGFCSRANCYPCQTGEEKCCFVRSLVYTSQCVPCKEVGQVKMYIGETSRSAHERGGEHEADYKKRLEDSHILKHQQANHNGNPDATFQFRVAATFQSALTRQITEAVMIRRLGEENTLNSKGMFNRCSLPRLTVQDDRKGNQEAATKDNSLEFDSEMWPGTVGWINKRSKQPGIHPRKRKKLKLDQQALLRDNPRQEGIEKRKVCFESDHERECKRLRPEFEPEDELRKLTEEVKPTPVQVSKPIVLFDVFRNSKKSEKSKAKFTPSRKQKKMSLTSVVSQQGTDIRKFFKQNQNQVKPAVVQAVISPAQQLSKQSEGGKEKASNYGVRGGKSGVTWEPGP